MYHSLWKTVSDNKNKSSKSLNVKECNKNNSLPFVLLPFIKSRHCYSQKKKKDVIMKINLFYLTQGHALLTYLSDHRWSQMEATLHFYSSFSWWYTERNLWIFTVPSQRLMLWLLKGASVQQLNGLKTSQRIHKKDGEINDTENTSVKLCRRPARLANPVCEL